MISGALLFVKRSFHLGGRPGPPADLIFASALVFILGSLIATVATSDGILVSA